MPGGGPLNREQTNKGVESAKKRIDAIKIPGSLSGYLYRYILLKMILIIFLDPFFSVKKEIRVRYTST